MANDIRLLPPSGMSFLPLVSMSGHSVAVHRIHPEDGEPGSPVPVRFRKDAFIAGCTVVGIDTDEEMDEGDDKSALVLKAIEAVIERNDAEEIDANGRPKLAAVKKQAGFGVTKVELDSAFEAFEKSLAE